MIYAALLLAVVVTAAGGLCAVWHAGAAAGVCQYGHSEGKEDQQ